MINPKVVALKYLLISSPIYWIVMKLFLKMFLVCACFVLAIGNICRGQQLSISVRDAEKKPLAGASVKLIKVSDSTKVFGSTDKTGIAKLDGVSDDLYQITISFVGYQTLEKAISVKFGQRYFEFKMKNEAVTLGEVSVAAQRPLIRQEDDKMIIDPMPLINSSSNTMEVLEKTPGLYVDQDGSIYLSSTNAAVIQINGREQKMSTEDIATLLRSLPPGSVDRIEVLRTPSTKYDAASSGGIINIILKKGVKLGRSGTLSAGMNQGFYGNQFAGASMNFSGNDYSGYANVNYNHNYQLEELNASRILTTDTTLHQSAKTRQQNQQGFLGYGINYDATKNLNLTYDGRVSLSFPKSNSNSINLIENADNVNLAVNNYYTDNNSNFLSIQQDLGLIRKFDTAGSEIDTKLSYSFSNNNAVQNYISDFCFPIIQETQGKIDNLQTRHFILLQSDLTYMFHHKIKLEAGIKSTYQNYNSKSDYFNKNLDVYTSDTLRNNAFIYQENINAVYSQASKQFGTWFLLKVGVRMEHTYMQGNQTLPTDTSFLVNRMDFFPYVYLSRKIIKMLGIELQGYLIYRRTINRPDYQNLNPYIKYQDQFMYETGNPALKPQFTDNYEINISYNDTPILAFGQNYTKDIFSSVVYKDVQKPAIAIRTYDNLGKDVETYVRLIAGIPPGGKYFFAIGAQYNYNKYNGVYQGEPLSYKRGSWRFFTFHALNLFKHTKLTLNGFMMVNGQQGFYELKNFGALNLGLTQTFFHNNLSITINARDVLRTMKVSFKLNQATMDTYGDRYQDNQRFGINLRYNFGLKSKQEKKEFMKYENEE